MKCQWRPCVVAQPRICEAFRGRPAIPLTLAPQVALAGTMTAVSSSDPWTESGSLKSSGVPVSGARRVPQLITIRVPSCPAPTR
ncbi:hypothetical protein CVO74_11180 [Xanthomonas prunicola]|uniref:Uncharacterized protein n=1 Tax=Xanthomonas prunicola TaxID=2053930 RepID=A0A2N3RLI3_9XANT|nr:hypothetical protein XpruCFBP8353_09125 [Xanthomonas prunicola]PKV17644.1 hypothetical protein XpruCFBP8354_09125 [Xanthomonas prunicola]PKV21540.1 hypothetical protein CVO74_11180 [Xanthomonas prunicola]